MVNAGLDLVDESSLLESGRRTLELEGATLLDLARGLTPAFSKVCRVLCATTGKVILLGVGKSGHIARKIAATMASTGTPAIFLHPTECAHGDIGTIEATDTILALSHSGSSDEILAIVPALRAIGATIVAMTGRADSALAQEADFHLTVETTTEACPLGLAPTTSTTAMLAMGDAIAIALLEIKNFSPGDFARSHPAGKLGRRLTTTIADVMTPAAEVPTIAPTATVAAALPDMARGRLGMIVIGSETDVMGIFTDGDLRRTLEAAVDIHSTTIGDRMTGTPVAIATTALATSAVSVMETNTILTLLASENPTVRPLTLAGAISMHHLLSKDII